MGTNIYGDIDKLNGQTSQLYDEQMKQQENIINTGTQQAIDEIERNKQKLQDETNKTNRALYADYQKQINPYGVNAENIAEQGLANSGVSESSRTQYYNTYQNARSEATNNANTIKADFDAQIAQARQNGNIQLAQSAIDMYKQKINNLYQMYDLGLNERQFNYQKEQDALAQSNWEKEYQQALEQAKWQQNFSQSQFDYQKTQDNLSQNNWQKQFDYQKNQDSLSQNNWQKQFDYQKAQDSLAQSNWLKEYELSKKNFISSGSMSSGGYSNSLLIDDKSKNNEGSKNKDIVQDITIDDIVKGLQFVQGANVNKNVYDKYSGKYFSSPDEVVKYWYNQ